uniref:Uncharacterized protein n=1 Tax=Arundo donax TaxID=35708 RepID=A0A0A9ALM7_ARUDO
MTSFTNMSFLFLLKYIIFEVE